MVSIEGVDYSTTPPGAAALQAAGKHFVCRYLAHDWRGIRAPEVQELTAAGIEIVANYEAEADRMRSGSAGGASDAQYAQGILVEVGLPPRQPIYFSADWDASPGEQALIDAYLRGAASVIGPDRVGVYGGYYVIKRCAENGTAQWLWQTYAWSGGLQHPAAHIFQYNIYNQSVGGTDVDLDRALQDHYGQASDFWTAATTPPPTTTPPPAPAYPTHRTAITQAGPVGFTGVPDVVVAERASQGDWCVHGTALRSYPDRAAPASTPALRGHRYVFGFQATVAGEVWLASKAGSWALATAFSEDEPEPVGKDA